MGSAARPRRLAPTGLNPGSGFDEGAPLRRIADACESSRGAAAGPIRSVPVGAADKSALGGLHHFRAFR